ncbi:uncharacterized protein LOC117178063 [Belonocnema kinseyi]|uniref:uncharacterized protein LOC117178063 n=1 Tax=Belonocnema kinseyi TaxID=2817044 RepID=UPI00143CF3F1|nr:uncharacterized protein LOC117178063 [Belonocnema kinseyi]XP_033225170.1 uncharacterized protein LOC117178063 [Belonocnema kinseyi]XP_033225171.1 uncharacterized protein LOC117178063 [Belonocnema kinseyi]XP_033225172.1 uncharacterized protein LOC117178063 [Belonocnema kinseyi]XP_033225173.1 uncharacterized protein LOC117178063 [Belonocnema kinseyi]
MTVPSTKILSITLTVFLIITVYLQCVKSFGKSRPAKYNLLKKGCNIPKTKIEKSSIKDNESETNTDGYIDPHYNCDTLEKDIVQTIPYQSTSTSFSTSCGIVDVSFTSACIRCGMCLAIAQQINQTMVDIHKTIMPMLWLKDTDATLLLRSICDNSFEHYSLRKLNGNHLICDRTPGATLVTSSVDGLWEKHLKKKCHDYIDEMGPIQLYERWQRWFNNNEGDSEPPDLSTILCRDDTAFFRDCNSIEEEDNRRGIPSEIYKTHVKILAELKWG